MAQRYDIRRNIIWDEDEEEVERRKNLIRRAMLAQELKAQEIERDKKARGYCARCGLLLPLTGRCGNCGCEEKRKPYIPPLPKRNEVIDHNKGLVKGGYVNPLILKMYK